MISAIVGAAFGIIASLFVTNLFLGWIREELIQINKNLENISINIKDKNI